jgi:hypothetical protein
MFLGEGKIARGIFVRVRTWTIWNAQPFHLKLLALLKLRWRPPLSQLQDVAQSILMDEVFGTPKDLGPWLFDLTHWHQSQSWSLDSLNPQDSIRADALDALTVLTQIRLSNVKSEPTQNLELAERTPLLMALPYPMAVKIPVISFQHFLQINSRFAFNSIRSANHPNAEDLVAYLYELLFIQQKIATALNDFLRLAAYAGVQKEASSLLNAEVDAIMGADLVFSYLKASLEKIVALTGLIYGITNLDSQKTHSKKLNILTNRISTSAKETPYGVFLLEFLTPKNLEELNQYRTGLLHKKGIADLQPHNYVGVKPGELPFAKIFNVLHEQHAKNTSMLLCALALLTDELVSRDPPSLDLQASLRRFEEPLQGIAALVASALQQDYTEDAG